jgi:hypothetical protein
VVVSTSDVLALLALVVSLASFVVAWFTFVQQYVRRADLEINLGPKVVLAYGKTQEWLAATVPISLTNTGARDAFITNIAGTLTNQSETWQVDVAWYAFFKPTDAGVPGETSVPWWSFDGWASPVVVPSRQSTSKSVSFEVGPIVQPLEVDDYRLTLRFAIQGGKSSSEVWSARFKLGDRDALDKTVGEGNVGETSVDADLGVTERIAQPTPG